MAVTQLPDLVARLRIDTSDLGEADKRAGTFGSKIKSAFTDVVAPIGIATGGIAGVALGLKAGITAAADFQAGLSAIAAVSGATAHEMDLIHDAALRIGKDTVFSATEAASAIEELAKAGVPVPDILNGAADAAVALAAAGGVGLADAAGLASNAMNAFNIKAADMGRITDVIAGAANASAIDMNEFSLSLQQVGAVANTVGLSFEDTSRAIALLGQAGIKGSDAGTSLKTMFLNLQPTTKQQIKLFKQLGLITANGANQFFDARGKVKSLADISGVLQKALKGQTQQQKLANLELLFGTDALRAAAVLANEGADGVNNMADAMGKFTAADVAAKRTDNFRGSLERVKGSLETFLITANESKLEGLQKGLDRLSELIDAATTGLEKGGLLGALRSVFGELSLGAQILTTAGAAFGGLVVAEKAAGAINSSVTAVSNLSTTASNAFPHLQELGSRLAALRNAPAPDPRGLVEYTDKVTELTNRLGEQSDQIADLRTKQGGHYREMNDEFANLRDLLSKMEDKTIKISADLEDGSEAEKAGRNTAGSFAKGLASGIGGAIGGAIAGALAATLSGPALLIAGGVALAGLAVALGFIFRDEIGRFLTETLPSALVGALKTAGQFLADNVPEALSAMRQAFYNFMTGTLPSILGQAVGMAIAGALVLFIGLPVKMIQLLVESIPGFLGAAAGIVEGIALALSALPNRAAELFLGFTLLVLGALGDLAIKGAEAVGRLVSGVVSFVASLPGRVVDAVSRLPELFAFVIERVRERGIFIFVDMFNGMNELGERLVKAVVNAADRLLSGFVGFVSQLPGKASEFFGKAVSAVAEFMGRMLKAILDVPLVQTIVDIFSSFLDGVKTGWNRVNDVTDGALSRWVRIVGDKGGEVVGVVTGLPGRITGALGDLGSRLYESGRQAIQSLINGLLSMLGPVGGAMSKIAGKIADHLPHSPAKTGPLSGRGSPDIAGERIGLMLASGLQATTRTLDSAARAATAAVANGLQLGEFDVNSGVRMAAGNGGSSSAQGVGHTTAIENHVHLPVVPFTPEQVAAEGVSALRNMEMAQRYR